MILNKYGKGWYHAVRQILPFFQKNSRASAGVLHVAIAQQAGVLGYIGRSTNSYVRFNLS
ncbi:hypothetical protein SPIRO4BDMA_50165 [uncultured spirochete]|uniref:Uncharacterized protein n=1 Tax=uncultured spirochete TaxID=156406 RepID=A0A3P3XQY6_9SPIR|nr:hypothetical protein SPIRO4BDMA_50165 [uncultured spirochete]